MSARSVEAPGSPTTKTRAWTLRAAFTASVTLAPLVVSRPSVSRTRARDAPLRSPTLWLAMPIAFQIDVPEDGVID